MNTQNTNNEVLIGESDSTAGLGAHPLLAVDLTVRLAAKPFPDGVPCTHRGCLHHVTHPCEGCGRIAGAGVVELENVPDIELPGMWERADFM